MAQQPNSMNPAWCAARVAEIRDHVNRPGACAPRDTYRAWLIELLSQLDNAADARLASWELEQQVWIAGALSLKRELAEATALATKAESRAAELERAFMPLPFPANTPPETQEWHFCQCGDDVTFLFWGYPDDQYGDTDFDAEPTWCEFVYCFEPTEHIVSAFWLQPKVFDPSPAAPAPLPSSPAATDRNPDDAMGRYETDGAPVWPEDDYIESGDVYLRRHEAEAIQEEEEEEPAAAGPPILELRAERVGFDSPEYAARIEKVQQAVESLEEKNPNRKTRPANHG